VKRPLLLVSLATVAAAAVQSQQRRPVAPSVPAVEEIPLAVPGHVMSKERWERLQQESRQQ
jgi:hypothetical protein